MFAKLIIVYGLVAVVLCRPQRPETARILEQDQDVDPNGSFRWSYVSSDGSAQNQSGRLEERPGEEPVLNVVGRAAWVDPEGNPHETTYTANDGGYSPTSLDVPTFNWSSVHPTIRKAVLYLKSHVENPESLGF